MSITMSHWIAVAIAVVLLETTDCSDDESRLSVNAFQTIQAEDYNYHHLAEIQYCSSTSSGLYLGAIDPGAYFGYYDVDFGTGAQMIEIRIAAWDHGIIDLHLDTNTTEPFVRIPIQKVDDYPDYCNFFVLQQFVSTAPTGVRDLHFTFDWPDGVGHFVNIDWFTFKETS